MRSISTRAWLLVIVSAVLQIYMFPTGGPMPVWRAAICWFALVPFLTALSLPGKNGLPLSLRNSILLGYLCGFLWYFGSCFWIYQTMYLYGGLPKPVSLVIVLLFSLYLGLYHALFGAMFSLVRRYRTGVAGALLLAPFLWVAAELARGRITGFPWDLLGNVLIDNLFVTRLAPVAGVMGISFLVAAVNGGFTWYLFGRGRSKWMIPAVTLFAVVSLQLARGGIAANYDSLPRQTAVLLQENLLVGATGREVAPLSVEDELQQFTQASKAPTAKPDVIVWPEAPAHFQSNDPLLLPPLTQLARTTHSPLIIGSLGVDLDTASPHGYYQYDSASLFDSRGNQSGRYDKIHLVPWGEYVPYKAIFSFAEKLTEGVGNMDPGHARTVFRADGHTYGVFICYESIFGDEVREFAKNGAEVLVNISDDGWYGETGAPWQHLNMARMRAIENHRWVLRSTNTGVTTSIDPWGRVQGEAPRHVRAAFAFPFSFEQGTTFYTRRGDWFAYLCAAIALLAVIFCAIKKPLLK